MKIAFDAKRAVQNNTGLGNYSRFVIEALSESHPNDEFVLFAPKKRENPLLDNISKQKNISFFYPEGVSRKFSALWRSFWINRDLKKQKIDIFHGLSAEIPFGIRKTGVKTVVTIHDLIFLHFPQYYKLIDRWIYRLKFGYACRNADVVIAVSECTKRDIIHFFGIPEEKIKVVYQGCNPDFGKPISEKILAETAHKYGISANYLLYTGSIEPRKNLMLVVRALKNLHEEIHLVAVGRKTDYQRIVEQYAENEGLTNRIHILNSVPTADLPAIFRQASVFCYPSFYEGFGIPIIEALSSGIPVIAATGSCLEEAGGADSIYVNPADDKELAEAVMKILENSELRHKMTLSGKEYVKRFEAEKIAEALYSVIT